LFPSGLNNVDDKYNNNASIDHNTKRKIDIDMNAPARIPKSATKEVPLQQLFSHVNRLIPPVVIKYGMLHVGPDLIRSKFSFNENNIENGFLIQSPQEWNSNIF
jgi:hypothetical protein